MYFQAEYQEEKEVLDAKRQRFVECDSTISKLVAEREATTKSISEKQLQMKKLEYKITRFHKDKKDASNYVEHMRKKHAWINHEKQ